MSNQPPFRSSANAGVFAYGCPPIDTVPTVPDVITPWSPAPAIINGLSPCPKCGCHIRLSDPYPCLWCMRADIDALKKTSEAGSKATAPTTTVEPASTSRGAEAPKSATPIYSKTQRPVFDASYHRTYYRIRNATDRYWGCGTYQGFLDIELAYSYESRTDALIDIDEARRKDPSAKLVRITVRRRK